MTRLMSRVLGAAGLAALLALGPAAKAGPADEGTCGSFGTAVQFVETPADAARLAKQEQKLVFVLHVSGLFEDPRFT
jgi:hypothetical protein